MTHPTPSKRSSAIRPFEVMRVLHKAQALESTQPDPPVLHLEIGQPTHPPPPVALTSASESLSLPASSQGYTPTPGLPSLQAALSDHYNTQYNISLPPAAILITPGSSSAFTALFATLFDPDDVVALPTPGYPCYRNILSALSITALPLPLAPSSSFLPSIPQLQSLHRDTPLRGLILSSPSNPTGATLPPTLLSQLALFCHTHSIWLIVDEIYHGISRHPLPTAAQFPHAIVVSSFSKYWCMPGFRVGWVVVQHAPTRCALEYALQNMTICAPTFAQYAALGALSPPCQPLLQKRAVMYLEVADHLVSLLESAGFRHVFKPGGGFYVWANCEAVCQRLGLRDSVQFCELLLEKSKVAVTPGVDFDPEEGGKWLRFSVAATGVVREAGERILLFLAELQSEGKMRGAGTTEADGEEGGQ
eukprot:GFKZ01002844.1.p1 GENE.GFKZ01002844.1~~GFKZ01002844.1.p1  ORF type:complete len:439 (-),score=42.59 GFKZ01002844.1:40-1296(-)